MKKLLYLLIALPLLAMVACSDDDKNLPDVKIGFSYSGCSEINGTLYAVQGDTLDIDSVFAEPVNAGQPAIIGDVTYVLDGRPLGIAPTPPFPLSLLTRSLQTGSHTLRLQMSVFQKDKTPGIAYLTVPVAIVATADEIPSDPTPSTPDAVQHYSGHAEVTE